MEAWWAALWLLVFGLLTWATRPRRESSLLRKRVHLLSQIFFGVAALWAFLKFLSC